MRGRPPSGKWAGRGRNKQNGFTYRIIFYLTFEEDDASRASQSHKCLQGFGRVNVAGMLNCADNTCRLDHTQQAG